MSNKDLTERYIYAATKTLRGPAQDDAMRELEGLIGDMLLERCGDGEPTKEQLRAVLAELGHPNELAARYSNGPTALIAQPYLTQYWTVLRIVLIAVGCAVALAIMLAALLDPVGQLGLPADGVQTARQASLVVGKAIGMVAEGIFSGLLQAFAWVTGIFAVMSRRGTKLYKGDSYLDDLPELPANRKPLGKGEPIVSIAFSVVFTVIMIALPQVICVIAPDFFPGTIPVFDPARMKTLWPVLLGIGLAGVVSGCAELVEGYYTRRLMLVNLGCNLLMVVCAFIWLADGRILSEGYRAFVVAGLGGNAVIMQNLNVVVLGAVVLGVLIDTAVSLYNTRRR